MKKDFTHTFFYLKKSYQFAKKDKKYIVYSIILSIIFTFISVVAPILSAQQILNLTQELWLQLFLVTIAILIVEILRNIMVYCNNYCFNKYFFSVSKNIELEVAKETLRIETETLNQNSSGLFIERITDDTDVIASIFLELIEYVSDFITNFGILISIFFLNFNIFLLYAGFLIIVYCLNLYSSKKVQEKRKIQKKKREEFSGFVTELVRGVKDIKILNAEKSFIQKTASLTEEMNDAFYVFDRTKAKYRFIIDNIRDLLDCFIILIGIYSIIHGNLVVGTLLVILSYRGNIVNITHNIEHLLEALKYFSLSAQRVFEIIDGVNFPKEQFGSRHLEKATGTIEFQNVSFSYQDSKEVLHSLNFSIKPNETVSFVGKSGAGKSTIFHLLSGLYSPSTGNILLDGIPIKELDKDSIRGNISVISQSPYIFHMSIRDNFKIIKEDVTDEEIVWACKMACLHDFIVSLKDGYDTMIGEGGVTLSGGERQRLAIARALILKTEIILFDEATSALDNEIQQKIQESILNLQGEYTILIIAHRLSTVIHSDRIFVINDGEIIGEGTHESLLENHPFYKHLYEIELKKKKD